MIIFPHSDTQSDQCFLSPSLALPLPLPLPLPSSLLKFPNEDDDDDDLTMIAMMMMMMMMMRRLGRRIIHLFVQSCTTAKHSSHQTNACSIASTIVWEEKIIINKK